VRSDPGAPRRAEYPSQSQGESPGYAGMPLRLDVHAVSGHGTVDVASVPNAPLPPRGADTIVAGMPERVGHRSRSLTLGDGGGAFIAFHGSWNRMPLPERGYQVVFVPFARGRPAGPYEAFADGSPATRWSRSSRATVPPGSPRRRTGRCSSATTSAAACGECATRDADAAGQAERAVSV
jgi:hypothetical protein